MKAWLKGGLIGICIYIAFIILSILLTLTGLSIFGNSIFNVFIILFFSALILNYFTPFGRCTFQGFGDSKSYTNCPPEIIIWGIYFIFTLVIYFLIGSLIGSLIGFIVGKIKGGKSIR